MIKRVQNKIILLVAVIAFAMIVGLYWLRQAEHKKLDLLLLDRKNENAVLLDKVIEIHSKSLQTFAYDYTYWDEMVAFVKSGNKKWAKENIIASLSTYNADVAWVYKKDLSISYSTNRIDSTKFTELPLPTTIIKEIVLKGHLYHFFLITTSGLMEISGASIHPSADEARITPPQGYYFIGRLWSQKYLEEISLFMDSQIRLLSPGQKEGDEVASRSDVFIVKNIKVLQAWDGSPLMYVFSSNEAVIAKALTTQTGIQFQVSIIFAVVIILSILFILYRSVNRPLHLISQSLEDNNQKHINKLQEEKSEFGNVAVLMTEFFNQREKLETEITERKRVEEQIKESLSLLSATLDSTTDGILVVDRIGKISGFNNRFINLWKIPENIIASKDDDRTLSFVFDQLKDPESFIAKVKDLYAHPEADSFDVLEFKDGRIFERYSLPQRIEGRTVGRVWSFRDVTERNQTEEALKRSEEKSRQSQKMESIGTLAGGIAHDFNNILAIIMGHASLLEMMKDKESKSIRSIDAIKKAVNRGAGLVNQILTFARKSDIKVEQTNVNTIIRDLVDMLQQTFPKTINFVVKLSTEASFIIADHNQIHQALLNISINARDAMIHGGTLSYRTKVVENKDIRQLFPDASEKKYLCISVTDTGVGIDEDTKKRIFEPFFSTKEFGKGTGLGLATVYGILQGHRGFVDVESKIGVGTTFYLYFPLNSSEMEQGKSVQTSESEIMGGTETVLIVEDEEMLLDLIKEVLESNGYKVLTASDGAEGLNVYSANKDKISLIITDMGLPKLSGYDMFIKMKQINPGVNVIFASGFLEPNTISEMYKAGAKEFIQKPYNPADILKKIRTVIDMSATT
jgi:two-component system, cell cycle sensor histidine kinase and response regulator CckA